MVAPHIEENVLDRYAMGTLPGESIRKIEEHLLACSFCQNRLVEADEFLTHFRAAAPQVELRPPPFWQELQYAPRLIWGGSAVVAAAFMLMLFSGKPQYTKPQPAIVMMQSLRGPESQAQMSKGSPGTLVFDVPMLPNHADYEIEIVDRERNEILKGTAVVKQDQLAFPIEKLASGGYWVRVYRKQLAKELVAEYGLQAK
jgi:hypothetical protein